MGLSLSVQPELSWLKETRFDTDVAEMKPMWKLSFIAGNLARCIISGPAVHRAVAVYATHSSSTPNFPFSEHDVVCVECVATKRAMKATGEILRCSTLKRIQSN